MSLFSNWTDEARRSLCAYGVDLIRTGCLLLRTTPSVAYRASILFQRFQSVAEGVRRKRGDYKGEVEGVAHGSCDAKRAGCSSDNGTNSECFLAPYRLPAHVGTELSSGVLALGDVYAPLDFCLFHVFDHDDIIYLAAACVLITAKLEDLSTSIRYIVNVFMRLNKRRRGEPVIELLKPPPEQYENFKACVREAEKLVLQALGFQTFVECPFKYAIVFLGILLDEEKEKELSDECVGLAGGGDATNLQPRGAAGTGDGSAIPTPNSRSPCDSGVFDSLGAKMWLAKAVCWLNDIPRSWDLYAEEPHVLALCALQETKPPYVVGLPSDWTLAFGVNRSRVNSVLALYSKHLDMLGNSETNNIMLLMARQSTKPQYPKDIPLEQSANSDATALSEARKSEADAAGDLQTVNQVHNLELGVGVVSEANASPDETTNPLPALPFVPPLPPVHPHVSSVGSFTPTLAVLQSSLNIPITTPPAHAVNSIDFSSAVIGCNTVVGLDKMVAHVGNDRKNNLARETTTPVTTNPRPVEEEYEFEDLKELQRRRRREEEAESRRSKRRRSSSRQRRRHRPDERKRQRSGSRRRQWSQSPRRAHGSDHHQRHTHSGNVSQRGKDSRRDGKNRYDTNVRGEKSQRHRK
uniref:Cyclin L1 n=1 Tax=Trypanosoma congolense (strain IL3000) TaxID=1068625 RepID=G0UXA1_TRYCI|nr:conserved hypothetical protein [Trypanosoma congolense IL3000]